MTAGDELVSAGRVLRPGPGQRQPQCRGQGKRLPHTGLRHSQVSHSSYRQSCCDVCLLARLGAERFMGSSQDLQELVVVEGSKMLTDGSLDVSTAGIEQNYDTILGPKKCQTHVG